jgi:hypothetical protein
VADPSQHCRDLAVTTPLLPRFLQELIQEIHVMALHLVCDRRSSHALASHRRRDPALTFWSIAIPACLMFWAAVAYGIHSAL